MRNTYFKMLRHHKVDYIEKLIAQACAVNQARPTVTMQTWTAYTDGSASPNPGPGGAGSVVLLDGKPIAELVHSGGQTTNNQMELYALIMTFPQLPKDTPVTLHTDSEYVQKGLTEWSKNWIRRGWKTAGNKPVKNKELWQQLIALQKEYPQVTIKWVKAHQDKLPMSERVEGWEWNVHADELANKGTDRSKMNG